MIIPNFRIGHGYDIHSIGINRTLILGGVKIKNSHGLIGHSDGDCLSHAIADSLLGAAGLVDIGNIFPNSNPNIKNINSQKILKYIYKKLLKLNYKIHNIDATIIIEYPIIQSFILKIKQTLSNSLTINIDKIGIKATTNEGNDSIGQKKAIAANAVSLIYKI